FLTLDRLSSYHSLLSITTLTSTVSTIFFFNDTATTEIYTLSLHDALPISGRMTMSYKTVLVALNEINRLDALNTSAVKIAKIDRSEEHTSELQSRFDLVCRLLLEKKKKNKKMIIELTKDTQ